jgi:tetratricopeptide (TPR) repeat protein
MTAENDSNQNEQRNSSAVSIAIVPDEQPNTSEAVRSLEEVIKLSLALLSPAFFCFLSQQTMVDPVTTAEGNSYERENIKKHFVQEKTDPITKAALIDHTLIANYLLKNIIESHNTLVTNISKATQEVLKKIDAQKLEIKDLFAKCASLKTSLAAYRDLAKECELDDEKQEAVADKKEDFSFILNHFKAIQEEITAATNEFDCPISMDTMADPCMASDGHTYERAEIAEWFRNKKISPKTGMNLQNKNFMPNHNLRQLIEGGYLTRLAGLSKSVSDAHQVALKALEAQVQMIHALSAQIDSKTAHLERCKFAEQAQKKQQEAIGIIVLDFVSKMEDFLKIQPAMEWWSKNAAAGFVGEVIQAIIEGPDAYQRLIEEPEEHLLTSAVTVFVSRYVQEHEDLWKLHGYPNFAKRLRDALYRTKYEGKSKEFIKKLFKKKPKEKKDSIQIEAEEKEEASDRIYIHNVACQTFQLPIVCDYFTGRSKPLADMDKTLTARHVNIITGPSGIGKTQLAVRYAHEKKAHYQAILWFDIKADLDIQFILLAEMWCSLKKPTPKEAITAAYLYLQDRRTLLVFDNVSYAESLIPYLPPNPTAKNFHLLITSENIDFGCTIPLKLSGLTFKEACDFVHQRLPDATEKEISTLLETVSDLPLTLSQAIAYVVGEHRLLEEYLQQVAELRREFAKGLPDLTNSSEQSAVTTDAVSGGSNITVHSVFLNFFCIFRTIKPIYPAIVPILSACAYFAPTNIPIIWLETGLLGKARRADMYLFARFTSADVQQALVLLQRYGLLQPNRTDFLQIHPLVQEVIRYLLTPSEQELYIGRIEQSLALFSSNENNNSEEIIKPWQVCVPHLQAVTKHHFESGFEKDSRLALALTLLGSHYFNDLNQVQRARDLFEDAEVIVRSCADSDCLKDLDPSITLCELGNHYLLNDPIKLEKTCDLFKLALNIKEKIFFQKYSVSCHKIVEIQKENCEEDLNKIVIIMVQIGRMQCKLRNFQESEKYIKAALNIVMEAYGEVHQKTSMRFVDLGEIYYEMKAFKKACLAFEKALGIQENCLSLNHPNLVETLKKLGNALEASQNLLGAVKVFERALSIQERFFGQNDYTETGFLLRRLAVSYARIGSFKTQTELLERALKLQEKQAGSDDSTKFFEILVELTIAYRNLKKNKLALYAAQRAYQIYRKNSHHSLKNLKQATEYIKMLRDFFGNQLEDEPPKTKQRSPSVVAPHASFLAPPLQYKTVESKEVNLAVAQNFEDKPNDGDRRHNRKRRENIGISIARPG